MRMTSRELRVAVLAALCCCAASAHPAARQAPAAPQVTRPFGTQRELAAMQQRWLRERLDTFVPALMRKHGIDMWVVPMREYAEDPVFTAITAPETFAARRRTIYVFFDTCAAAGRPPAATCVQRIALGGSSQGGVFEARRSTKAGRRQHRPRPAGRAVGRRAVAGAEVADRGAESRAPSRINRSTVFAFSDGLSSGELQRHERGARREMDREVPRCRSAAARAHRVAPAGRGGVLPADAGAGLVDDRRRCSRRR